MLSGIATDKEYGSSIYLELKNQVLTLFKEKDEIGLSEKMMPLVYKIYDMNTEFEHCRKELILKNSDDSEYIEWLEETRNVEKQDIYLRRGKMKVYKIKIQ